MDNQQDNTSKSRRHFFSSFFSKKEKVKMLTADGKLVEVDKEVYLAAQQRTKASNQEILDWMDNPSKKD